MSLDAHPLIADWIDTRDGRLLIRTGKVDIGQRISTALLQIAHEELTVPYELIDIAAVRTGESPDEGITSGSNSVEQSGNAVRRASATLRGLLIADAAERHGGEKSDWIVEGGALHLPGTNHRLLVTEMIKDTHLACPIDPEASIAQGHGGALPAPPMRGLTAMTAGNYTFVHDLDLPGMLHARVIRPPHAKARLKSIGKSAIERAEAKGLRLIQDGSFLALIGPKEWPVVEGALKLSAACDWDIGDGIPEIDVFGHLTTAKAVGRFLVVDGTPQQGPVPDLPSGHNFKARYERPYQMHGALAPSAALAQWDGEKLCVHTHSQGIYPLRESMADSLGLDKNQVEITHVPGSGCYGHNGADDAALEAALIALAMPGIPILLKWTREEEHCWEPYAPAMVVELAATMERGRITAFSAEAFSDTHRGRPRPGPNRAGPSKQLANRFRLDPIAPNSAQPNMGRHAGMHRNLDPIYDFANKRLVKNLVTGLPHRTSAMRTLGAAANIFAIESFMDEMARINGSDPFAIRRAHLSDPRAVAVLDALERQVAELPSLPATGGRGIAYAQYKNQMTRVGICVDVSANDRAEIRLNHCVIVADAGRVIDADGLVAQLEGGFLQAASWSLYEKVVWNRDGIQSRDWDSYPVIRFDNIPAIKVIVLDRPDERSVGAGEASPGPTIAAIANAIFDATGIRMRRMPFRPDDILRQAVSE
jgi:CO/xanthine dehydrogenase Mo-binding subunit